MCHATRAFDFRPIVKCDAREIRPKPGRLLGTHLSVQILSDGVGGNLQCARGRDWLILKLEVP